MKNRMLVSACLLGINCKYNNENNKNDILLNKLSQLNPEVIIPVCPEQLGGLPTPRTPVEIVSGTGLDVLDSRGIVRSETGIDVSEMFRKGAIEVLKIAKFTNCNCALLKDKSPSCGVNLVYDGTFNHQVKPGSGVCASLLKKNGIKIFSETDVLD